MDMGDEKEGGAKNDAEEFGLGATGWTVVSFAINT